MADAPKFPGTSLAFMAAESNLAAIATLLSLCSSIRRWASMLVLPACHHQRRPQNNHSGAGCKGMGPAWPVIGRATLATATGTATSAKPTASENRVL